MDVLQDWARGFVDRDGKFVEEFQTTFNSSFWELYLFAVLKRYGMSVDFSQARPDFCIPSLGLNIEATIASDAQGAEPEFARLGIPPGDLNIFNLQTIVRLSNSLAAKHRKYIESYAAAEISSSSPSRALSSLCARPRSFRTRSYTRCGCRRTTPMSMPSSSQCSCSTVNVGTSVTLGQLNRSSSSRLSSSQNPLRSQPSTFTRLRRRLLNAYTHAANGSNLSVCCTSAARPLS